MFHLDGTLIWGLRPWNHLLAWGGSEMLSRGRGVKNGLQGGRMATYPPTHTYDLLIFKVFRTASADQSHNTIIWWLVAVKDILDKNILNWIARRN